MCVFENPPKSWWGKWFFSWVDVLSLNLRWPTLLIFCLPDVKNQSRGTYWTTPWDPSVPESKRKSFTPVTYPSIESKGRLKFKHLLVSRERGNGVQNPCTINRGSHHKRQCDPRRVLLVVCSPQLKVVVSGTTLVDEAGLDGHPESGVVVPRKRFVLPVTSPFRFSLQQRRADKTTETKQSPSVSRLFN